MSRTLRLHAAPTGSDTARRAAVLCAALLVLACPSVFAADPQYRFSLDLGYRWKTDTRGSQNLYRSQVNLGEGPKVLSGDFFLAAPQGSNRWLDRFELRMNNWGGEPYNTFQARAFKTGLYDLRLDYQNAQYFSAIPSFANPLFEQGNLLTQHKYDISQRVVRFQLTLLPQRAVSPYLVIGHSARLGPVRTTLTADASDEFVLRSDIDSSSNDFQFGANFRLPRLSLRIEQGFRRYKDHTLFSAGPGTGNSTRTVFGRDITLSSYQGSNNISVTVPFSSAVAVYEPFRALSLRGKVTYSNASLETGYAEQLSGTLFSTPQAAFYGAATQITPGVAKKPDLFGDLTADWHPVEPFHLTERFTVRRFHVSGSALTNSTLLRVEPLLQQGLIDSLRTSNPFQTFLSTDVDTQELEGIYAITPRLLARLGHRFERKEVAAGDQRVSWSRNALLAGASYDFSTRHRLALEYELGRTDQPIFRTDAIDFTRLRLRGRVSPFQALEVNGSVTLFDSDDGLKTIDSSSRNRSYGLQVNYAAGKRITLTAEYEHSSVHSDLLIVIPQTFLSSRSVYLERGNYANLYISVLLPRNASASFGYSVLGSTGNYPINYHRPFSRVDVPIRERLVAYLQWNFFDYNEKLSLRPQDYGAHLVLLGFRVKLDHK